jgi:hypothetical protein
MQKHLSSPNTYRGVIESGALAVLYEIGAVLSFSLLMGSACLSPYRFGVSLSFGGLSRVLFPDHSLPQVTGPGQARAAREDLVLQRCLHVCLLPPPPLPLLPSSSPLSRFPLVVPQSALIAEGCVQSRRGGRFEPLQSVGSKCMSGQLAPFAATFVDLSLSLPPSLRLPPSLPPGEFDQFRQSFSSDSELFLLSLLIDSHRTRVRILDRQKQDMVYLQKGLSLTSVREPISLTSGSLEAQQRHGH